MHAQKPAKAKYFHLVWKGALSLALLAVLFVLVPWDEMVIHLRRMTLPGAGAAIVCVFLAVSFSVLKWGALLRGLRITFRWKTLWWMYWAGFFCNQFAPGGLGADGYRILQMGRRYHLSEAAAYSVVVERILAIFSLGATGVAGYWLFSGDIPGYLWLLGGVLLAGALLFAVVLWVPLRLPGRGKLSVRISAWLQKFSGQRRLLRACPLCMAQALVYTVAFHLANYLLNYVLLAAIAPGVTFLQASVLTAAVSVLSMVPVSVNGLGVREFAYVWVGGAMGLERGALVAASLMFAFFVMITTLYGGLLMLTAAPKDESPMAQQT